MTGVRLREVALPATVTVRGEPPVAANATGPVDGGLAVWLGPDEWLVLGATEADYAHADAVVDVSASRVCFELAGADAAAVLARGCSLDLDALVPGRCAQTLLARVDVLLLRPEETTWRVLVRPSYAGYVRAWLEDALREVE